jgi:2-C-methyl-D-erythritol 4-phosphate cytidylyltransferase
MRTRLGRVGGHPRRGQPARRQGVALVESSYENLWILESRPMTSPQRGDSFTHPFGRQRLFALVPCAGSGSRAGAAGPKQYEELAGRALVLWTLEALAQVDELDGTLVVLSPGDTQFAALAGEGDAEAAAACWRANVGGATRAETVSAGLHDLLARGALESDWVLVHDAARCLIRPDAIRRLIAACRDDAVGGLLALPLADTLKRSDAHERVDATVPRERVWAAQTPQMFRVGALRDALRAGFMRRDLAITDEASAIEAAGQSPRLVRGDFENIKVTWPEDFALAERLLRSRSHSISKVPKARP